MKKLLALLLAVMMVFSLSACGDKEETGQNDEKNQTQSETDEVDTDISSDKNPSVDTPANSIEELEDAIFKDVEDIVNTLNTEWQELSATITSYDDYLNNIEKVEAFYEAIINTTEQACIRLQEYAIKYAEMIMSSDMSNDERYDAFSDLYDCIYDDAADDLYDGIYDDLFDDMYDAFYRDLFDEAYDDVPYSEWSDAHSNEYKMWSSAHSDVYGAWSDTHSDIYEFCSDMRGNLWSDDINDANETLEDYKEDVEKLKK